MAYKFDEAKHIDATKTLIKKFKQLKKWFGCDATHIVVYKPAKSKKIMVRFDGRYDNTEDAYWHYADPYCCKKQYELHASCKKPDDFMIFGVSKYAQAVKFIVGRHMPWIGYDDSVIFEDEDQVFGEKED